MQIKKHHLISLKKKRISIFFFSHNSFHFSIYLVGPLGKTSFKLSYKVFQVFKIKPLIFFITSDFLNTFLQILKNKFIGILKGFYSLLIVRGLGYRFRRKKLYSQLVRIKVGLKHYYIYKLPNIVKMKAIKYRLFLLCLEKDLLPRIIHEIRLLRYPDPYKGKGIRYYQEPLKLKVGKQR